MCVIVLQLVSDSESKCLKCNQKLTGSQFSLLHEPNYQTKMLMEKKTKNKTIEQSGVCKGRKGWGPVAGRI